MEKDRIIMKNIFVVVALLAFAFVSFFWFFDFGMNMNPDGTIGSCPFNPDGSICMMSLREHLNMWQLSFEALPQSTRSVSSALFLFAIAIALKSIFVIRQPFLLPPKTFYAKQHASIFPVDPIKQAIYRGIINPKVF